MLNGFKQFIMRGNLVELAVAFIIGGAFALVVTSFTDLVLAAIAKVFGSKTPNMDDFNPGKLPVGPFLTATISFLILAFVVYFFVVTPYNTLQKRMARGEEPAPPSPDVALLTEIRDLLAKAPGTPSVRSEDAAAGVQGSGGLT
ncbi:large conductance mechanosensitive channel protein MscL [Nocardioides mesophilus]|uniref:Large-conductance mechanosensitive channel n=1 Tax=Nocardioides mesophilus TaxID=433659 RepID=A0A7G9R7I4_9ACTN|nr:large conductance mechanosensitive channel protein MscL [Nocardioides mesophilus]QNN51559.1 large conductance mechanosensitive channel protein MscL [Nocardioides mesophilus]